MASSSTSCSILGCFACKEKYNTREHTPRLLGQCGHTLCELCLHSFVGKQTNDGFEVCCPTCQTPTRHPEADLFPKNLPLLELIGAMTSQPKSKELARPCVDCQEREAEFSCVECGVIFCPACWAHFHRFGKLRAHPKRPCPDLQSTQCSTDTTTDPTEIGHSTDSFEQALAAQREQLREGIGRLQRSIAFGAKALAQVLNNETLLLGNRDAAPSALLSTPSNHTRALKEIDEQVDRLSRLLQERKASLIDEVNQYVGTKAQKLSHQKTELSAFLAKAYSVLQAADDALASTDGRESFASFEVLRTQLHDLSSRKLFAAAVVTPVVTVSFAATLSNAIGTQCTLERDCEVVQSRQSPNESDEERMQREVEERRRQLVRTANEEEDQLRQQIELVRGFSAQPAFNPSVYDAAGSGNIARLKQALKTNGQLIDTPNPLQIGKTPMHHAAENGHVDVIALLVRLGSQAIDSRDFNFETPIIWAAARGHVRVVEILVRLGSQAIDTPNNNGLTPLHYAVITVNVPLIEKLVKLGSQALKTPTKDGRTPLQIAGDREPVRSALVRLIDGQSA